MRPDAILEDLRTTQDRIPEEALLAAMDQPEAVIPGLLALLDEPLADPAAYLEDYRHAHLFALYLLAQFKEPRALPKVLALLRLPEDHLDGLLGDLLTEGMPSVLASFCAGNPAVLETLAADQTLDTFVRTVAMDALLVLGFKGLLPEKAFLRAFDTLLTVFEARGAQETAEAWAFLVSACATGPFAPLKDRLRAAYAQGLVDADILDPEGMEAAFTLNPAHARRRFLKTHHPVEDAILDLEDQGWFEGGDDEEEGEDEDTYQVPALAPEALQALVARHAHEGPSRNGPCPCGSGKKYKRCCGKG